MDDGYVVLSSDIDLEGAPLCLINDALEFEEEDEVPLTLVL
jgi:hypothetical protein